MLVFITKCFGVFIVKWLFSTFFARHEVLGWDSLCCFISSIFFLHNPNLCQKQLIHKTKVPLKKEPNKKMWQSSKFSFCKCPSVLLKASYQLPTLNRGKGLGLAVCKTLFTVFLKKSLEFFCNYYLIVPKLRK